MKKKTVKEVIGDTPVLFQYVRKSGPNKHKVGILVAVASGKVGWALCKKPGTRLLKRDVIVLSNGITRTVEETIEVDGDKFNFEIAFGKACKRAWNGGAECDDLPFSIIKDYEEMMDRSIRYFKEEVKA